MTSDEKRLYQLLGQRIKRHRTDAGLTQAQLAQKLGVRRTSVTNMEAGRQSISLFIIYNLLDLFNVRFDQLLPPLREVLEQREVEVPVDNQGVEVVPPKTADVLRELLDEE